MAARLTQNGINEAVAGIARIEQHHPKLAGKLELRLQLVIDPERHPLEEPIQVLTDIRSMVDRVEINERDGMYGKVQA